MSQIARALEGLTFIFILMANIFELVEGGEYYLTEAFIMCALHHNIIRVVESKGVRGGVVI